jgi:hypothetical protein
MSHLTDHSEGGVTQALHHLRSLCGVLVWFLIIYALQVHHHVVHLAPAPVSCVSTRVVCLTLAPMLCILCSRPCHVCTRGVHLMHPHWVSRAHTRVMCLVPVPASCVSGPRPLRLSVSTHTLVHPHPRSLMPTSAIVVCILVISI